MTALENRKGEFRFTGWHMFACMVAFFGVIISVNVFLAVLASKSWTGLVVKNSYVASQKFNDELAAAQEQKEKGWRSQVSYVDDILTVRLTDRDGEKLILDVAKAIVGRPAFEQKDTVLVLRPAAGFIYRTGLKLAPGEWVLRITGTINGHPYRRDARLFVNADGRGSIQ